MFMLNEKVVVERCKYFEGLPKSDVLQLGKVGKCPSNDIVTKYLVESK